MKDHIKYRIERARETFQDAVFLYEKGSWGSAINRLYYSAFYAAVALLLFNNIEVKSHNGVKIKIGEFVVNNKLQKKHSVTFGVLSNLRHKGDYDDLFDFDKSMVEGLLTPVEEFITEIVGILKD